MIDRESTVTTDELHAHADGLLPADRHQAVEAWLANHPDDAALVGEWRAQAEAIRSRYGAVALEPTPERFNLDRLMRTGRGWRAVAAAAAVAALLGGGLGWMAHGVSAALPSPYDVFTTDALTAHKLYSTEVRHPIEVRAAEDHLVPWLSRRVGTPLRTPDLAAFKLSLLGGRLLPGPIGPAALFMYEGPTGERVTIYCARLKAPRTALRYNATGDTAAVRWVEGDIGYAVSGPTDRDLLLQIAQTTYEQMENRGPTRSSANLLISRRGS
jgi:anti-sigma factor RsiW